MSSYQGSLVHRFQNAPNNAISGGTRLTFPLLTARKSKKFDADSGLVFTEGFVSASSKSLDWVGNFQTPGLVRRRKPNAKGAASLLDMAKASMARNMRSITVEHLQAIPWIVGRRLWEEIIASRTESFHTWRIFATAYPQEFNSLDRRCHMAISAPPLPLIDYYTGLNSASLSYLVALRIAPRFTQVSDLIRLSAIQNLAVLDLSDPHNTIDRALSTFDERVLRAWAELACSSSAQEMPRFQNLRVLLLGWQDDLDYWLFQYLDAFPQLCHVIVTDCRRMQNRNKPLWLAQVQKYGWEPRSAKKSAKSLRPIIDEKGDSLLGRVSGLVYESEESLGRLLGRSKENIESERKPVAEMWLNHPRPWVHVVDEFPGTRTVWFDRINNLQDTSHKDSLYSKGPSPVAHDHPRLGSRLPDRGKRARDGESTCSDTDSQRRPRKLSHQLRKTERRDISELLTQFS